MLDLLVKLRVLDPDHTLSLTSLLLMVALVKFAVEPINTELLLALLGAAATYSGKKVINKMGSSDETSELLASQATELVSLKNKMALVEARTAPRK
jgi:hypothetical protein